MLATDWPTRLQAMPPDQATAVLDDLEPEEIDALAHDWSAWRRPEQAPPLGSWRYWLIMTGRGWGKTRTAAEQVRRWATSGKYRHVNVIGATADDVRDIMIEGESGILAVCPASDRPRYVPSKRRLEWPNGCWTLAFTADEPERLRGKQHQKLWGDELAAWRFVDEAWTQAKFGLRLPPNPQAVITTTPKPLAALRRLLNDPATVVTGGHTDDNRANLDPGFYADIIAEYRGTSVGRQELAGQLLEEAAGALARRAWIDASRVAAAPETMIRVAVGVDPSGGGQAECGIVAAALGDDDQKFILGDWSERMSAGAWGAKVWRVALEVGADVVAAEKNFGGDMVMETLRGAAKAEEFADQALPRVVLVNASRGKAVRAEPWSLQYEQGKIHHVGELDALEDEWCTWVPGAKMPSPNRLDAEVWALVAASGQHETYAAPAFV